ncbi:GAF and ANTAR domain-containing protein [Frankia sp. CcWB2]
MSSAPSEQAWSTVDAALRAASALHRMETACFVMVSTTTASYLRVTGPSAGLDEGTHYPRGDSLVARVLDGTPATASGLGPTHAGSDTAEYRQLGIRSHVTMPVVRADGRLVGLLVGLDHSKVIVSADILALLRGVADALAATGDVPVPSPPTVSANGPRPPGGPTPPGPPAAPRPPGRIPTPQTIARAVRPGPPGRAGPPSAAGGTGAGTGPRRSPSDMRLRRTPAGWVVEGPGAEIRPVGDLLSAMVLADLLAEDLAPPGRPRRPDRDLSEVEQLRLSVVQLEHALASRVIVEQAIGVLAEHNHIRPREAFERLRRTARGMGRRVHDLARQVVDSVGDPRAVLPGELGGRGGNPPGGGPPAPSPGGGAPRPAPPRPTSTRH